MRKVSVYVRAYEKHVYDDYGNARLGGWSPCADLTLKATWDGKHYVLSAADYDHARDFFGAEYPFLGAEYAGNSDNYPTYAEIIRGE